MKYAVARSDENDQTRNTLVMHRPKMAHISALLKSNSGAVPLADQAYTLFLPDGEVREGRTDADGLVHEEKLLPGDYEMQVEDSDKRFLVPTTPVHVCRRPIRLPGCLLFEPPPGTDDGDLPGNFDAGDEHFNPLNEPEPDDTGWELVEEFVKGEQSDA